MQAEPPGKAGANKKSMRRIGRDRPIAPPNRIRDNFPVVSGDAQIAFPALGGARQNGRSNSAHVTPKLNDGIDYNTQRRTMAVTVVRAIAASDSLR
ncbi:unnamed protein product, partial [Iphiclides podalirius]